MGRLRQDESRDRRTAGCLRAHRAQAPREHLRKARRSHAYRCGGAVSRGTALSRLTAADATRVLRFVADAEELGGDEPFTKEILVELRKLVPADWVSYCEQDRVRR